MTEPRHFQAVDPSRFHVQDTARHTRESRELIEQLVKHSIETADAAEARERQMLRWTQAGVVLAAIAAVGAIASIIVTLLVG